MELKYSIMPEDLVAGSWFLSRKLKFSIFMLTILLFLRLMPSLSGGEFHESISKWFYERVFVGWIDLILGIFPVLCVIGGLSFMIPWVMRRQWQQHPYFYLDLTGTLDDAGVRIRGPRTDTKWQWADFTGYRSERRVFLLSVGRNCNVIIPKHDLSADQKAGLEALLSARMKRLW